MYLVRPARVDDLPSLVELARLSGPGFTSLPDDETLLAGRLQKSVDAYAAPAADAQGAAYMLMMENAAGAVVGCAAVKTHIGMTKPFFNFKIFRIAQASSAAERRFDMDVMVLVNEYAGNTEVGSLFVHADARGGGAGRLLAQSRYLLMAAAPERFDPIVIAELRGVVDDNGDTPFWRHLGSKFFQMSFTEADELSAVTDSQFILDLMPKYPIYIDLLPEEARDVIGMAHPEGVGAERLLEWEGFRYDRVIDIFDGGPLVSAPRDQIRTVRDSVRTRVTPAGAKSVLKNAIVSTDDISGFCVRRCQARLHDDHAEIDAEALTALGLEDGAMVRLWVASS